MPPPPKLDAADKSLLAKWDAEIDADDAVAADLLKTSLRDELNARHERDKDQAPLLKRMLDAAGTTRDALTKLDDQDFARGRKVAAVAHKRAVAVSKKRTVSAAAETQRLLANLKAGR